MSSGRIDTVDALRGAAMVWMTAFHFCFDLSNAGLIQANFYRDPVWTWQRTCILSLFLLCAGAGQAIAVSQGQSWQRFWRRWAQIAACALLVTLGSALVFPKSFIYFGVLHGMAVMLLIARLSAGCGRWLWPMGAAVLALKFAAPSWLGEGWLPAALNDKTLNWIGLVSVKPITEDYVPLVPWLAVVWWGMAATQWWLRRQDSAIHSAASDRPSTPFVLLPVVFLGRWSLSYYMVHQPVLLAGLWLWQRA
jgi:uncharacterized membrane protein